MDSLVYFNGFPGENQLSTSNHDISANHSGSTLINNARCYWFIRTFRILDVIECIDCIMNICPKSWNQLISSLLL